MKAIDLFPGSISPMLPNTNADGTVGNYPFAPYMIIHGLLWYDLKGSSG